jgi:very-short-patch-repair endonuclease
MRDKVSNVYHYKSRFIEKSIKKHSNKYDYSLVNYINSTTKVEVICKEHGSFWVRPDAHIRKVGCPSCNGGIKYDKEIFIEKANTVHNNLYDYSDVEYINSSSKVKITCRIHGSFRMVPRNHLMGQKCPSCSGVKRRTTESFIRESSIIHNQKYDYSLVNYKNNLKKVEIICKEHGKFLQTPKDHLRGHGCNKCSNFSSGERKIEKILSDINIKFIREYKFDECVSKNETRLPFDFYLPDFRILIEYDGKQHFEPVDKFGGEDAFLNLKKNDSIRNKWCELNNIKLIRIGYKNENNDIKYLLDYLNNIINSNIIKESKLEKTEFDISLILNTKSEILKYLKDNYNNSIIIDYMVDGFKLDFYLPDNKIGIRILSNFKNSENNSNWKSQKKVSELDIKVIQIFEDNWINKNDIVKSRLCNILKTNKKIGSRECKIVEIDSKTTMSFLNKNHLQGGIGSSVKIGLEYRGELVSVMTFGKLRKNLGSKSVDGEWELIRFCNKNKLTVIGSASKLFNFFIKKYKPNRIISYADKLWSNNDNVYEKIGMFKVSESKPSYFYILGNKRVGRFSLRKDVLVSMGFSNKLTEREICYNNGVYRIYDAGSFKYEWNNQSSEVLSKI